MRHKFARNDGFTLVESIVYMGVFVMLLAFLTGIFSSIIDAQQESQASSAVQLDSQYILSRMRFDLHSADDITLPLNPGDTGSTLEFTDSGQTYTYTVDGGVLYFTDPSGGQYQMNGYGSIVTDFTASRLISAPASIRVQFSLESVVERISGNETRNYETTFLLR